MPNAAILEELQPVLSQGLSNFIKTDNFENVAYDINGFLYSFKYKKINYVICTHSSFYPEDLQKTHKIKAGFYNEDQYREYMLQNGKVSIFDMVEHNFTFKYKFTRAEAGDTIITVRPEINESKTWFYRTEFSWTFDPNDLTILDTYAFDRYIVIPSFAHKERTPVNYDSEVVSFFQVNATKIVSPNYTDDVDQSLFLLAKTAISIQNAINISFDPFYGDSECENYIERQKLHWKTVPISQNLSYAILSTYYNNLSNYREEVYKNQHDILYAPLKDKLFTLVCGLSAISLNLLSIQMKKEMLTKALNRLRAGSGDESLIEYFVIKTLMSFRPDETEDINSILKYLLKTLESDASKTYYEAFLNIMGGLWDGESSISTIGDWTFQSAWEPENRKDAYIKAIYILWLMSKYNPYKVGENEGDFKENIGIRVGTGDEIQYEVPYLNTVQLSSLPPGYVHYYTSYENKYTLDYNSEKVTYERSDAAPIVLNYESSKKIGFYEDNFRFIINGTKILAIEEFVLEGGDGDHLDRYFNILRGTYDIFQPVQLLDVNQETIIPMPLSSGSEINVGGTNINSLIPVFILKYIDDNGDSSDLRKAMGLYVDFVLTVSGIGNLTKLMYLTHLSRLEICSRVIFGTIEVTASIGSAIVNHLENHCTDPEFCKKLANFFFFLEIASLSADSLYSFSRAQRAAKEVKQHIDDFGVPSSFNHAPTLQLIIDLSDIENYLVRLKERIKGNVRKRIKSENIKYNAIDNLEIGTTTKFPPRFSQKKFTKSVETTIVNGKEISANIYTKTANELHSVQELEDMLEYGYDLKLTASDIEGLILKSYRTMKQVDKLEVIVWMDNYDDFLKPVSLGGRGKLAYCFTSQSHFELFASQYNYLRSRYGMQSIKSITFGGSCTIKLIPPDLDLVHYISKQKFDDLINHYEATLSRYISSKPKVDEAVVNRVKDAITKSRNTRKIDTNCMIHFDESTKKIYFFKSELTNLSSMKTLNLSNQKKLFDFSIFDSSNGAGISPEYTFNLE